MTTTQSRVTLASILQENEFLKSELEVYKKELIMAREAYERELNLYTLAHAASTVEKSAKKDQYSEYMCSQCGNIYHQVGYKIVKVPLPGSTPTSNPIIVKKERPAITQEPAGPSNIFENEVKPQIFRPTLVVKIESLASRPTKTVFTQTEPRNSNTVFTQVISTQAQMDAWKKEYVVSQERILQEHKISWKNHVYENWEVLEQSCAQNKENKQLKTKLSFMLNLVQRLLATRKPSFNYSVFLEKYLAFFQAKAIRDGRSHEVSTPQEFIKTFTEASFSEQNLLCELYLHNEAIPEDRKLNLIPLVGDIQVRSFVSFLANQPTWKNAFLSAKHNEYNRLLWIRSEPQNATIFVVEHHQFLKEPRMAEHLRELQATILQDCQYYVKAKGALAL